MKAGEHALLKALAAPSSAHPGKTLLEEDLINLEAVAKDSLTQQDARQSRYRFSSQGMRSHQQDRERNAPADARFGKPPPDRRSRAFEEALSSMGDLFSKNEIQIEKNFFRARPSIHADHDELLQVLSNLLRNSMQAIQEHRRGKQLNHRGRIFVSTTRRQRRRHCGVFRSASGITVRGSPRRTANRFSNRRSRPRASKREPDLAFRSRADSFGHTREKSSWKKASRAWKPYF